MAGIGFEIDQITEQFKGKPDELAQKYSMDPKLAYLMALNRINSGQTASPNTVLGQQEQQLAAKMQTQQMPTQQGMMQRVAPTMNRVAGQQQQQMQQAPQQAMQMAQQAQQGIGQLAQQMQRPQQPQRMASGGIVQKFAEGGSIEDKARDAKRKNLSFDEIDRLYGTEAPKVLQAIRQMSIQENRAIQPNLTAPAASPRMNVGRERTLEARQQTPMPVIPQDVDPMSAPEAAQPSTPAAPTAPTPKTPADMVADTANRPFAGGKDQQGLGSIVPPYAPGMAPKAPTPQAPTPQAPTPQAPDYSKYDEQISAIREGMPTEIETRDNDAIMEDVIGITGEAPTMEDAEGSRTDAMERAKQDLNYYSKMDAHDVAINQAEKVFERQNDPDRRRWQRISAFLRGFAGKATIGEGFAAASQSRADEVERADAREREAFKELNALRKDRNADETQILSASMNAADSSFDAIMKERQSVLGNQRALFNTLKSNETNVALKEATLKAQNELAKISQVTERYKDAFGKFALEVKTQLEREKFARMDDSNKLKATDNLLSALAVQADTIANARTAMMSSPDYMELAAEAADGNEKAALELTLKQASLYDDPAIKNMGVITKSLMEDLFGGQSKPQTEQNDFLDTLRNLPETPRGAGSKFF